MKNINDAETLKSNINSISEKSAEMAKLFVESSAKQFEASLNAGKTIFDSFTKQSKSEGKQGENIKASVENTINATKSWAEESSKIFTQLYDKQFSFVLDSYSNFMDMAFENLKTNKKGDNTTEAFREKVNFFLKNIEESSDIMKKMFSNIIENISDNADKSYIKEISDLMQETYSKQTEQLLKFNKNLLDSNSLQNVINLNKEISEKLQKDMEKNLEASKKIIQSISENYLKENNFSPKSGKKMLDDVFAEIDVVTKNNIKFWTKWLDEVYTKNKKA